MTPEFEEALDRANHALDEAGQALNQFYLSLTKVNEAIILCRLQLDLVRSTSCDNVRHPNLKQRNL